jgi:Polyketide cyclase / dehydrase and lipid transport
MPKRELEKTFRVPMDKALEYFGNHELYNSMHTRSDTTYTIVSRRDNEVLVDVKQDLKGQTLNFTNKTVYRLPESIESETLSGMAKGSRQKVTFASVPEGTKVTYTTDFKLEFGGMAGKALRMVSGKMMKKMIKESMQEAAEVDRKYLEGEQPQIPNPE